ncbi:MAG: YdcF family protein [Mariprofundales bacterium]|nr:YdcF family protein [Mariprofundales bacterium]
MLISKSIAVLLLPPGSLILLLAIALLAWRRWWSRWVVATATGALLLLSLPAMQECLISPLEMKYPPFDEREIRQDDAIVVLGGGVSSHAPEYHGRAALSQATMMRVVFALSLLEQQRVRVWVSGGAPLRAGQQPEGEVMRRWLIANRVPEELVVAENSSGNTWQNAANIKPLLIQSRVRRVVLITTAWHMPRAVWCFEQLLSGSGIVVVSAPCDYSSSPRLYTLLDWLPDAHAFARSVTALHEYLGLLYYHLRYGVNYRV